MMSIILIYAYIFRMLFLISFPNFQIYGGCFSEDRCWYRCVVQRMINNEKAGTFLFPVLINISALLRSCRK